MPTARHSCHRPSIAVASVHDSGVHLDHAVEGQCRAAPGIERRRVFQYPNCCLDRVERRTAGGENRLARVERGAQGGADRAILVSGESLAQ